MATLLVTLANKEPTPGMLLSGISGTLDTTADEVGSTSCSCKCIENKIMFSVTLIKQILVAVTL